MLCHNEYSRCLLCHTLVPSGPIPTVGDPEGIYPYESYCETSKRPSFKNFRFISIENDYLRVEICPDLGGKVHSIFHKRSQREILFQPGSIRPTRILPRLAFISGGIETSFPISHTPVQLETVYYIVKQIANRLYVWCGERELRYGMQWTVEYSLGEFDTFLTQRTLFFNPTSQPHPWMAWSNAALPAYADTQFHFPNGKVLYHGNEIKHIGWAKDGPRTMKEIDRMAGYFWESAECNAFGVFNPDQGCGLYHIADSSEVPGIKLWVYGTGKHEKWAHLSAIERRSYVEIQAGPIKDQSIMYSLQPNERHLHTEFWIPSSQCLEINEITTPSVELVSDNQIPLFEWVERSKTRVWLQLLQAYRDNTPERIPLPPEWHSNEWPPSGMDELGEVIQWAISLSKSESQELWKYYLAVWYAGCGYKDAALSMLSETHSDWARVFEGRLLRYWYNDAEGAAKSLSNIKSHEMALHPQVMIERDITLSLLKDTSLSERGKWLNQVNSLQDDALTERMISYLLGAGNVHEAKKLLESTNFEPIHQRYVRTELWGKIQDRLNQHRTPPPENIGEDDLAQFGRYRTY